MNRRSFFAFSLLAFFATLMFISSSVPRFEDLYECYIIVDAEVSDYQGDDYEQIDYEDFLSSIRRARRAYISFVPAKEVRLYDDEGVRYMVYISKSCRFLRIDSNYFKLSKRQSKRLKYLLGA